MNAAVLQFHHREAFEHTVTRALAAGAGAGLVQWLSFRVGMPMPLTWLVPAAVVLACARGDRWDRGLLSGLGLLLVALPYGLGLSPAWTVATSGAAAGALLVRSRLNDLGEEGQVAEARPTLVHYGLGAVLGAGLTLAGGVVANILSVRLASVATPTLLAAAVVGGIVGLFVGLGAIAAHLGLTADPVEARAEELLPQLSGDFHTLSERALSLYRQCGQSLAKLPREPAREELARTLARITKGAVELASEWAGVEAQLEERAAAELQAERESLERSARASTDVVARRQLEAAAASLAEEVERLGDMRQRRERILARLRAEVALLERARVALLSLRSGQAQLKAAELASLARRFRALSTAQGEEGQAMDAVAAQVTLTQVAAANVAPVTPVDPGPDASEGAKVPEIQRIQGE
ncbi:hypothetical protein HJC22_38480 [Corallococcus exiguus]|uniref:hypothetical protein n=1 Tax=Corallococcus TaxID=83461 RepID=UPI000EA12BDA|nr:MULTISPECIES: hypothetical protein [Corallococcus]RKH15546.1 hypothetical protein D7V77_38880 [Corallococcus sp. CA041A]NNC21611.1 hypothetical protein [Corallococcus exiguus]NRD57848.1 hypothetical protein [Corallococcus exiguus]RKI07438.1 hypothetical protein D7Y15_28210 [Corallococcus sp. AB030]RUO89309.1 hypothetical protein D7Y11_31005 [Corallococcus sp. AB018]